MKQGIILLIGIIVALVAGAAGGYYAGYNAGMSAGNPAVAEETLVPGEDVLDIAEEANPFTDIQEQVNPFSGGYENPFAAE